MLVWVLGWWLWFSRNGGRFLDGWGWGFWWAGAFSWVDLIFRLVGVSRDFSPAEMVFRLVSWGIMGRGGF